MANYIATIGYVLVRLCPFIMQFFSFSSYEKVNEPKENLPCRKTGFRWRLTRAHDSLNRPVVDANGLRRSEKARKLYKITLDINDPRVAWANNLY